MFSSFSFKNYKPIGMLLSGIIACLLLMDFGFSSKTTTEKVVQINSSLQRYFNAAGNSHQSYSIQTETSRFLASKDFAKNTEVGTTVELEMSFLFNEVNAARNLETLQTEVYSLRWFTGLALPILGFVFLGLGCTKGQRFTLVVFVMELLLISTFCYVLLL